MAYTPGKAVKIPAISVDLDHVSASLCPRSSTDFSRKGWKDLVQISSSCVKNQSWDRLEETAQTLSQKEPFQPWGSYFLSLAAEGKKEFPKALWYIDLAIKKNPSYGILFYQKGRLLWAEKNYGEAVTLVTKSLEMDFSIVDAILFLGQVHFRDQEYDKASEYFYSVLKAKPTHILALSGLAESRLQRKDYVGALETLQRAVSYYPEKIDFKLRQAYIYETLLNDKVNALNIYIQIRRKVSRENIKTPSVSEIDQKIQFLENKGRLPAVSSAQVPMKEKEMKR